MDANQAPIGADPDRPVRAIADTILAYLETHSMAGDSVIGVAQWWLGDAHPGATLEEVEQALELLVSRNRLRRVDVSDGTALYSHLPPTRQ